MRLSEWAREQGIARITAYRMVQRGILPVPCEQSPTGRWYVLVSDEHRERTVFYARATPGADHAAAINQQIVQLSEWATKTDRQVYMGVREVAVPVVQRMPKLARLLADHQIGEIVVENPHVLGEGQYELLVAALTPQGRRIVIVNSKPVRSIRDADAQATIRSLCQSMYGPAKGAEAAHRALEHLTPVP